MKRSKRHKIKTEPSENKSSRIGDSSGGLERDFDLAHYIHDRVELLQRAFAALKPRELKTMAPACVAGLTLDDLQELCLEELLGISSVRLCAILDGADPPSNTESSDSSDSPSAGHLETISLDSISSDEDTLNPPPAPMPRESKSGKHKRRCRRKEARKAEEAAAKKDESQSESQSRTRTAERAGMTVLELLELQARARAIRAQLAMEHKHATGTDTKARIGDESDNDVQIKEEPPEVVELSSDEELQNNKISVTSNHQTEKSNANRIQTPSSDKPQNQANNKSDLIIVVPNTQTRKIKLKRNKLATSVSQESADSNKNVAPLTTEQVKVINVESKTIDFVSKTKSSEDQHEKDKEKENLKNQKDKIRHSKQKKKRNKHKTEKEREGSDHDEITLQLSDTEKMDLEDFDRKNLDNESSSESDTSTDGGVTQDMSVAGSTDNLNNTSVKSTTSTDEKLENHANHFIDSLPNSAKGKANSETVEKLSSANTASENKDNKPLQDCASEEKGQNFVPDTQNNNQELELYSTEQTKTNELFDLVANDTNQQYSQKQPSKNNDLSEGEISDRSNFEIETSDIKERVQSKERDTVEEKHGNLREKDEFRKIEAKNIKLGTEDFGDTRQSEGDNNYEILVIETTEAKHCKLHKDVELKQTYSEMKLATKDLGDSNQSESGDICEILEIETTEEKLGESNKDVELKQADSENKLDAKDLGDTRQSESEDVYEILEISDDSSCYEVEGVSVLSKEPTTEEIEAFSAKIDHEIHREQATGEEDDHNIENISWKHRYLDSKKVKRIMSTANILNALRKKNIELKKKIEESKNQTEHEKPDKVHKQPTIEEGTVNHYNTLEGSTKYVAPPTVPNSIEGNSDRLHKEMEKDAKQLLKMYKRLLKYNDMNKESRKKKSKKKKKRKEKTSNEPPK